MNNEEKILAILENMDKRLGTLEADVSGLKEGQTRLEADVSGLKEGQARLEADVSGIKVRLDIDVQRQLNLLAEGQEEILSRMPSEDDMDIIDGRLDALEAVAKTHSKEIAELKKAQ